MQPMRRRTDKKGTHTHCAMPSLPSLLDVLFSKYLYAPARLGQASCSESKWNSITRNHHMPNVSSPLWWLKMGVMISTRSKWNMVKTGPGGGLPLPEGTCRKPTASTLRLWNLQSLLFVQLIWAPQLSSLKITWICLCLWGLRYSAWLR